MQVPRCKLSSSSPAPLWRALTLHSFQTASPLRLREVSCFSAVWNFVKMRASAGKIMVVVVKDVFFSWCTVLCSRALKHLHWAAALPSAKPPPLPTFISMVTWGRHSAASKLLLLFHHASWHCQGLSVFLQLWMNVRERKKNRWIWMGSCYLGGPTAGEGRATFKWPSVRTLLSKEKPVLLH